MSPCNNVLNEWLLFTAVIIVPVPWLVLFLKQRNSAPFGSLKWTNVVLNDNGNDVKLLPVRIETAFW